MNEEPWNLKAIAVGALVFAAAEGAVLLFSGAFPNRFDPPRPGPGLITFFLAGAVAGMAGGFATALFTQRDALVHLVAASWMVFALIVFPFGVLYAFSTTCVSWGFAAASVWAGAKYRNTLSPELQSALRQPLLHGFGEGSLTAIIAGAMTFVVAAAVGFFIGFMVYFGYGHSLFGGGEAGDAYTIIPLLAAALCSGFVTGRTARGVPYSHFVVVAAIFTGFVLLGLIKNAYEPSSNGIDLQVWSATWIVALCVGAPGTRFGAFTRQYSNSSESAESS